MWLLYAMFYLTNHATQQHVEVCGFLRQQS